MARCALAVASLALLGACAPAAAAPGAIDGSLPGFSLELRDAVFVVPEARGAFIHLTDLDNACALMRRNAIQLEISETRQGKPGSRFITWTVLSLDSRRHPIAPGRVAFAVPNYDSESGAHDPPPGVFGFPVVGVADERCRTQKIEYDPSRVELELSSWEPYEGGVAEGRFEIVHEGSRLGGRFRARYCALSRLRAPELPCSG